MADFLSNLVARTLRQGPMLERRRPSLFEVPRALVGTVQPDGLDDVEATLSARPPVPTPAAPRAPISEQRPVAESPVPPPPSRQTDGSLEAPRSEIRWAVRQEATAPVPNVIQRSVHLSEQRIVPERTVLREKQESLRETLQTYRESIVSRERVETRTVVREALPSPRLQLDATAFPPSQVSRVVDRVIARERPAAQKQAIPMHTAPPRRDRSPVPPAAITEPAAPSVSISIGRVEIRAAQPGAASTRAAKPTGPKLSLDDYLHGRSGGSR